jgi:Tir chaperone protein (CesT) family
MPDSDYPRTLLNTVPSLVRDTLALAGLSGPVDDVMAGMPFIWRGQRFLLHVGEAVAPPGGIVVHAELGDLSPGHEVQTCELLLRSNLLLAGNVGPTFGMQLDGVGLLMLLPLSTQGLTAADLLKVLQRMADAGEIWRHTRGFALTPAAAKAAPPGRPQFPQRSPFGTPQSTC